MRLGFVSGILPDLCLEELLAFAAQEEFECVEVLCWPMTRSDSASGVCHLDVNQSGVGWQSHIKDLVHIHGVDISALGYYGNPLAPDRAERMVAVDHLKRVIETAPLLGVGLVNTFIGRDPNQNLDDNWQVALEVWPALIEHARAHGVRLGIENCPMLLTPDQWPGGMNLAVAPMIWRKMLAELSGDVLGINFDPSHLVWQRIDLVRAIREFGAHLVHVHAKDTRIDSEKLYESGILGQGWHLAKLPGLGEIDWKAFFSALTEVDYRGSVCIEVEDRAYEGSLEDRKRALRQSRRFLTQWIGR